MGRSHWDSQGPGPLLMAHARNHTGPHVHQLHQHRLLVLQVWPVRSGRLTTRAPPVFTERVTPLIWRFVPWLVGCTFTVNKITNALPLPFSLTNPGLRHSVPSCPPAGHRQGAGVDPVCDSGGDPWPGCGPQPRQRHVVGQAATWLFSVVKMTHRFGVS